MDKHTQMTDYELELLINEVEGTQMLEAPKRLKDEVLMKSRSIQTQIYRARAMLNKLYGKVQGREIRHLSESSCSCMD